MAISRLLLNRFHVFQYIFDWAWANFYQQNQIPYYPKLVHTLPFTPINSPTILSPLKEELIKASFDFYQAQPNISGEHYLFINEEEEHLLSPYDFSIMETMQYHWKNEWGSFDEFLMSLKNNRRKMIRKERRSVEKMVFLLKS